MKHALKYLKFDIVAPYCVHPGNLTRRSQAVKAHAIVLFMKGVPDAPQCGFSRTVAKVLEMYEVPSVKMKTYNVLEDPELRTAIKEFSYVVTSLAFPGADFGNFRASRDWPTVPQLYVNGEFVGGCDIVLESESLILDARMLRGY